MEAPHGADRPPVGEEPPIPAVDVSRRDGVYELTADVVGDPFNGALVLGEGRGGQPRSDGGEMVGQHLGEGDPFAGTVRSVDDTDEVRAFALGGGAGRRCGGAADAAYLNDDVPVAAR